MTGAAVLGLVKLTSAQALVPGWETDPTAVKGALGAGETYQTPEAFKYPYVSTYYVKPTVAPNEVVKIGFFVTDFESSKIRFLDDSHRFTAYLEYRRKADRPECDPYQGGRAQTPAAPQQSKVLTLKNLKSGDGEFKLGKLPVGEYEMRIWAKDAKGRESHRVIQDFRVVAATAEQPPYRVTAADLAAYGIRNDGDIEKIVHVGADGKAETVKEKRAGVPGYTVKVPLDSKTGKVPYRAYEKVSVEYDVGYDAAAVEQAAVKTAEGLQKLIDEKSAAGVRKLVLPPGTYRVSHTVTITVPDRFTLDLGEATIKLNQFAGESSVIFNIASATDAHLVGGTVEGDYWAHDYKSSPKDSEWVSGIQIGGDSWYSSVENVRVVDITGYGGQNGIAKDKRGDLAFIYQYLPKFAAGGLDPKTGEVNAADKYRFTTDFKDLKKAFAELEEKGGCRRLQICKYLGYQGVRTRSWQMTVCWYDAERKFISSETCWQYREMWIPEKAAYLRVSVEEASVEAANKSELVITGFRLPVNCAVRNCTFDHCRCVGYAASAMRNMLFEGNFFTRSGEAEAKCAFDAEDGADQMQDVYFLGNRFRDNPINNSILTCAGHNFILEKNQGGIHFWGRTHSPCVRDNDVERGEYWCDSRVRSGYGRFEGNRYSKGFALGKNEVKNRPDSWDYVISGRTFDGTRDTFNIETGTAGRLVGCTFRNMGSVGIANAYACTFENCKGWCTSTRWTGVTVKDSTFKGFWRTNSFERCHFVKSKLDGIARSTLFVKNCDFADSLVFGLNGSAVEMENCTFTGSTVEGNWWESPASVRFLNCTIATRDDSAFLKLGVYTIGKIGFDKCTVSGREALFNVKDLRPLKHYQGENPDLETGRIALRSITWKSKAKTVITHGTGQHEELSTKKISIVDKSKAWPKGVAVATDLFPTWELKQ